MSQDEKSVSTSAVTVAETKDVKDLITEDARKDESTAHLTLPALPQERGVLSSGVVTDEARVKQSQDDRASALGEIRSDLTPAPQKVSDAGAVAETRQVEMRVNEKANTQEAVTVVSQPPAVQPDAINAQQQEQERRAQEARDKSIQSDATTRSNVNPML